MACTWKAQKENGRKQPEDRLHSPYINRWLSADTVVPNPANPQSLNRYSWVLGNPLAYGNPSGHKQICLKPTLCTDESDEPTQRQDRTEAPSPTVPAVVVYIYLQMIGNAKGETVQLLQQLNESSYSSYWADVPIWWPGVGEGLSGAAVADASADAEAIAIMGWMVRQKGPWDPKKYIGNSFTYSQEVGGDWYYDDIWGNIMYGYLGAAAGFSSSELLNGAGMEQVGSSIGYAANYRDPAYLPTRQAGVPGLAAWDDPADQVTAQLGVSLWNTYGLEMTPMDVVLAVTGEPGIPRKDEPWD